MFSLQLVTNWGSQNFPPLLYLNCKFIIKIKEFASAFHLVKRMGHRAKFATKQSTSSEIVPKCLERHESVDLRNLEIH